MKNELDLGTSLDQVTKWLNCQTCGHPKTTDEHAGISHLPFSKAHAFDNRVTLQCNECGKKRKVSADGNYNDRCPKCGGVDWDVVA